MVGTQAPAGLFPYQPDHAPPVLYQRRLHKRACHQYITAVIGVAKLDHRPDGPGNSAKPAFEKMVVKPQVRKSLARGQCQC